MGLYNFQKRFAPFILRGDKTHTIRSKRKRRDKPGNTLHLYTGLRQKGAQLLMRVPCVKVEDILIRNHVQPDSDDATNLFEVAIDGLGLERGEKETLARRDGFRDFADMMDFWKGRLPFTGDLIHWKYPSAESN